MLLPLSEVRTFFRFCPACGKRFHIKLVSKKLEDERREQSEITRATGSYRTPSSYGGVSMPAVVVEEKVPITIDVEDFQYTYKCKHCGHVWSELHTKEFEE